MSSKHTPGPWHYDSSEGRIYDRRDDQICDMEAGMDAADKMSAKSETDANARLIAAAPDLLAACKAALAAVEANAERYPGDRDAQRDANQLRAAIARAEGGEA